MGILSTLKGKVPGLKSNVPPDVSDEDKSEETEKSAEESTIEEPAVETLEESEDKSSSKKGKKRGKKGKIGEGGVPTDDSAARLSSTIERIQVQLEGLNVARGASNEKFTRISEQIGELRTMIIESEKRMRSIDANATKAVDLVNEVHPENLSKEIKLVQAKNEQLKARIEVNAVISKDMIKEMKKIRNHMDLFQGTEGILKLNEEVKEELISIQKLKAITEGHSDKVENIFLDIQKNFSRFERFKNDAKNIESNYKEIKKIVDGMKVKEGTLAEKQELIKLKEKTEGKLRNFQEQIAKIEKFKTSIDGMSNLTSKISELSLYNKKGISKQEKELAKTNRHGGLLLEYLKKLTQSVKKKAKKEKITEINKKLNKVDDDIKDITRATNTLINMVERMKRKL